MKLPAHDIKKIAIFRALQLGDMLCSIPAIRALRYAYPQSHITLIGLPWASALQQQFPNYLDAVIPFPGYPGLPEQPYQPTAITSFLQQQQQQGYDLVIQMQGNGTLTNSLVALFDGRYTAGFYLPGRYCPDKELFFEYPSQLHEIERHVALMEFLGIPSCGLQLEYPITEDDRAALNELQLPIKDKQYICVHPGSRDTARQWPPAYFAALADHCAQQGLQVVVTGTTDELPLVQQVAKLMKHQVVIAAGKTSLGAVGALLQKAALLISNCTGVSHIAAALGTPSVVISMDGEPHRWAPLHKERHITIDWTTTPDYELALQALKHLLQQQEFLSLTT